MFVFQIFKLSNQKHPKKYIAIKIWSHTQALQENKYCSPSLNISDAYKYQLSPMKVVSRFSVL